MRYKLLSSINHFDILTTKNILHKNKIDFFFKNTYDSSVLAGWFNPGSSFNEQLLFVDDSKIDLARTLLVDYLNII